MSQRQSWVQGYHSTSQDVEDMQSGRYVESLKNIEEKEDGGNSGEDLADNENGENDDDDDEDDDDEVEEEEEEEKNNESKQIVNTQEPHKKRQRSTLAEKIMILDYLKNNDFSQHEVVYHFRDTYSISTSSLSAWLQKEDDLRRRYKEASSGSNASAGYISNFKKKPFYKYKEINEAMLKVVNERLANQLPITDRILLEYWIKFAKEFGVSDPKRKNGFSRGWLSNFKKNAGLLKRDNDKSKRKQQQQTKNEQTNDEQTQPEQLEQQQQQFNNESQSNLNQPKYHRQHHSFPPHSQFYQAPQQPIPKPIQSTHLQHSHSDSHFHLYSQIPQLQVLGQPPTISDYSISPITHSNSSSISYANPNAYFNDDLNVPLNPFYQQVSPSNFENINQNNNNSNNNNNNDPPLSNYIPPTNRFFMMNEMDNRDHVDNSMVHTPISYNNYGYSRVSKKNNPVDSLDELRETVKQSEQLILQLENCMNNLVENNYFNESFTSFSAFKDNFFHDKDNFIG